MTCQTLFAPENTLTSLALQLLDSCTRVALVDVRFDVVPLPPRSSSPTVAGCRLGGILLDAIGWVESAVWEGC